MKKTFYSLLTMALAVFALTSCEDVPAPFDFPTKGGEVPEATAEPAGSGTVADPYNVAAAIEYTQSLEAGTESPSNIYIKGIISSIREEYSTQYGNGTFYISDDGSAKNQFLVYRALYLKNKKFSASDTQIQVGDSVIICGIVTNYNGTLETQQNKAYLYALNGAGGGGGGGGTSGEAKGSGTLEDPYNPAGAADAVKNLTWTSNDVYDTTGDVYVKGKISRIADKGTFTEGGNYGNASFYISEDGTENGEFYCFRILYLGNKKFESGKTDIKVGDEVIICGQLMNYRGNTPETVAGKAYLYSLNGKTEGGGGGGGTGGDAKGSGTLTDPYNPAGAADAVKNLTWTSNDNYETTGDVYVKGKISRIADKGTFTEGGTYGNASFYISEDGTQNGEFYCFRILYLGNKKFESGKTDIKVGDEVIICGQLMNYRGNTPETVAGKAYLYSLNGKTDSGGGGGGGSDEVKAVTIAEFNAASVSNDVWYKLTGTVKNLKDGDKYGNFDLEDATGSVYVYGLLAEKGGEKQKFQDLVAAKGIQNGSKITIIGNRGDYQGKIEVLNAYFVSIEGGGGGGGDTPSGAGSYSNPYSVSAAIAAGSGTGVYVKAYIVGCVSGQVYDTGATFDVLPDVKTNLLIAESSTESDPSKCMPVQLPSGDIRNGLNLVDNASNLGKEVLLYGNIEAYFKVPGIKSVTYAEIGGKSIGTKSNVRRKAIRKK